MDTHTDQDQSVVSEPAPRPVLDADVIKALQGVAAKRLRRLPPARALRPSDVVGEVLHRLIGQRALSTKNRAYLFAACTTQVRYVILDELKRQEALKRGGGKIDLSLDQEILGEAPPGTSIHHVNEVLDLLKSVDHELYDIVNLRFYGGLSERAVAECLQIPLSRVKRRWKAARAWLCHKLAAHG